MIQQVTTYIRNCRVLVQPLPPSLPLPLPLTDCILHSQCLVPLLFVSDVSPGPCDHHMTCSSGNGQVSFKHRWCGIHYNGSHCVCGSVPCHISGCQPHEHLSPRAQGVVVHCAEGKSSSGRGGEDVGGGVQEVCTSCYGNLIFPYCSIVTCIPRDVEGSVVGNKADWLSWVRGHVWEGNPGNHWRGVVNGNSI